MGINPFNKDCVSLTDCCNIIYNLMFYQPFFVYFL
jgi:hypothetical protein